MPASTQKGWNFYLDDHGRTRLVSVAAADFEGAEKLALARVPTGQTISYHELGSSTVAFLKLARGEVMEWVPAGPHDTIKPTGTKRA